MNDGHAHGRPAEHRLPRLEDVLPHKPPMVLLDEVIAHTAEKTTCIVRIQRDGPFTAPDGTVPNWVAVEYMAQCAAAHAGLRGREAGAPVRIGFLLGSRRIVFHAARFELGQELEVSAHEAWTDGELASFTCEVRDRAGLRLLAECEISAYRPNSLEGLNERPRA